MRTLMIIAFFVYTTLTLCYALTTTLTGTHAKHIRGGQLSLQLLLRCNLRVAAPGFILFLSVFSLAAYYISVNNGTTWEGGIITRTHRSTRLN